jgi:peptide/nickel transport system permease protein
MARHVLPNLVPVILVLASSRVGAAILLEASLSFLGYGVPPPSPTLGGMLGAEGRIFMIVNPAMCFGPLLVLGVLVYALNVVGDALRDEFDPRLRGR